uniref:Kinesin-like protein n=1 Tax=Arcella intermedia TaxID=1963864 RepID=A0A6B2KYN3_9EUKA
MNRNSNITVAVRVRPLNYEEVLNSKRTIIKVIDDNTLLFDPDTDHTNLKSIRGVPNPAKHKDQKFYFDRVFNTYETTKEVYEHTTKQLVETVLEGYNCCCFAYGATGAGKTYTMLGTGNSPGVMVLTMEELFKKISNIQNKTISVSISYLEVYNESIRDLLVENSAKLLMHENAEGEVSIADLTTYYPHSAKEVISLLQKGNNRRSQSPTEANLQSSRSHAVFQVTVQQKEAVGTSFFMRNAKLSLIDLAGSEKAAQMKSTGMRFMEGANINKSLLALGNCINALGQNTNEYIPFRTSKLTRLLKDSLGGNCKTVMIANISPSELSFEDTKNTLDYSNRAKNIKTSVKQNGAFVKQTKSDIEIMRLRKEVAELTAKNTISEPELQRISLYTDQIQSISVLGQNLTEQINSLRSNLYQFMNELDNIWKNGSPIEEITRQFMETKLQINQRLKIVQQHLLTIEEIQDDMENTLSISTNKMKLQRDIANVKAELLKLGFLQEEPAFLPVSSLRTHFHPTPERPHPPQDAPLPEPFPAQEVPLHPVVEQPQTAAPPPILYIPPPQIAVQDTEMISLEQQQTVHVKKEENFNLRVITNEKPRLSVGRGEDNFKVQHKITKNKAPLKGRKSIAVPANTHNTNHTHNHTMTVAKRNYLFRPSIGARRQSIAPRKSIISRPSIGQNISKIQPRKSLSQGDLSNRENIPPPTDNFTFQPAFIPQPPEPLVIKSISEVAEPLQKVEM